MIYIMQAEHFLTKFAAGPLSRALPVGSVSIMPAGTRHFAWTGDETVVQIHDVGPWGISYVNPADDPRKTQ